MQSTESKDDANESEAKVQEDRLRKLTEQLLAMSLEVYPIDYKNLNVATARNLALVRELCNVDDSLSTFNEMKHVKALWTNGIVTFGCKRESQIASASSEWPMPSCDAPQQTTVGEVLREIDPCSFKKLLLLEKSPFIAALSTNTAYTLTVERNDNTPLVAMGLGNDRDQALEAAAHEMLVFLQMHYRSKEANGYSRKELL